VNYFHVERRTHFNLLIEGLLSESHLDTGNRGFFANATEPFVLDPELANGSDCPIRGWVPQT
jgi:hypothetical protein